jgi:hypothetical protein
MKTIYFGVLVAVVSGISIALVHVGYFPYIMFAIGWVSLVMVEISYGSKRKRAINAGRGLQLDKMKLAALRAKGIQLKALTSFVSGLMTLMMILTIVLDAYKSHLFIAAGITLACLAPLACRRKAIEEKVALASQ